MKKKYYLVAILLMLVGFAAVSTTLYINGSAKIKANKDDFHIYYSNALVNGEQDLSVIVDDTTISFTTTLDTLGQTYVLEYDVTNGSKNYDADLEMVCTGGNEYLNVTNEFDDENILESLDTRNGILTLELVKSYTGDDLEVSIECTISANAQERDSLGVGGGEENEVSPIKFRQPYVLNTEVVTGEMVEVSTVFYENGLVTIFANGDHDQDVVYPVAHAEYSGDKIKIAPLGIDFDVYHEEYTVEDDGSSLSHVVYVSSTEGDYEYTETSYLTDLSDLKYNIPIDIDLSVRSLSSEFCIGSSSGGSEVQDPETYERIHYIDGELYYMPNVYPDEFSMMMDELFPNQEVPDFKGIVKIYYNKNDLRLVERDNIGSWDNNVWTFTNEEIINSSDIINIKLISNLDGVRSSIFGTSVGLIMFES